MPIYPDLKYRHTVLVVDDTADNLTLMSNLLKEVYRVKLASSGEKALRIALAENPPDLILLDIMMPEMDGYQVCAQLKAQEATRNIPVIFLTASNAQEDEQHGFELGAVDYITKPINPSIFMARVATQLRLKASADFLRDNAAYLESVIEQRTRTIQSVQDVTIRMMASLAETRDNETGNHIFRTQRYIRVIARCLQNHPRFQRYLGDATIDTLYKSAPLHDIGKIGIPDRILLKPGKLTPDEFEIMKTHTNLGSDVIAGAEAQVGEVVGFLACAREIAYSHHEKWDGSGYPQGLSGDDIPISARLMALADVYDALISRRIYKPPMTHADARHIILQGRGQHFDSDIVDAFLQCEEEFITIAARFEDKAQQGSEVREGEKALPSP
ncbi:MAG: two-component system response regulator [Zoogloeaceae bacterium]|jgi:putative two-component system response regulator|nr:two-component system response regulator [Zoogloeaceae bacterium]